MNCKCGCGQETKVSRGYAASFIRGHNNIKKRPPIRFGVLDNEKVALIPLSTGDIAIISEEDLDRVSARFWTKNPRGYAMSSVRLEGGKYTVISLHRFIMGSPNNKDVDHRNGVLLDCRRSNLRVSTTQQNLRNQKCQAGRTSKFKGVSLHRATGKWESYITIARKKIHLGFFSLENDAAQAYNKAAVRWFGEFAKLNEIERTGGRHDGSNKISYTAAQC